MKRRPMIVLLTAAVMGLGLFVGLRPTIAQPAAGSRSNIATIDIATVIDQSQVRTALEAQVNQLQAQINTETEGMQAQVTNLQTELQALQPGSSAHQNKQQELEFAVMQFRTWVQFQTVRLTREGGMQVERLYLLMNEATAQVAQENNVDVVLFYSSDPDLAWEEPEQLNAKMSIRQVIYASEESDITSQVIQRMNTNFQAGQ